MKQKAIIIDLDGTLVDNGVRALNHLGRRRENLNDPQIRWDEFFESSLEYDKPHKWCQEICESFVNDGYHIIFLTGRMETESTKRVTEQWLLTYCSQHVMENSTLIMRPNKDFRFNQVVKMELMGTKILPYYDVLFAIDDMKKNIDMFRNFGITALHCADL